MRDEDEADEHERQSERVPPSPQRTLVESDEQPDEPEADQQRTGKVEPPQRTCSRLRRRDRPGGEHESQQAHAGAHPVGGRNTAVIGDEAGQRIAEPDPGRTHHRERSDRPCRLRPRERLSRSGHRQRQQRETEALQPPAHDQERQRRRDRGHRATENDESEPSDDHPLALTSVAEPTDHRRRNSSDDERRRQRPLRAREAHIQLLRQARDQRSPKAGHDRDDRRDEEQHRNKRTLSGVAHLQITVYLSKMNRVAAAGECVIEQGDRRRVLVRRNKVDPFVDLTPPEREVLALMDEGCSKQGIWRRRTATAA